MPRDFNKLVKCVLVVIRESVLSLIPRFVSCSGWLTDYDHFYDERGGEHTHMYRKKVSEL